MKDFFTKFKSLFLSVGKTIVSASKSVLNSIYMWLGDSGIIKIETCIISVIGIDVFLDCVLSGVITLIIAVIKICYDKYKVETNDELHDFICCILGVMLGIALSSLAAHFYVLL